MRTTYPRETLVIRDVVSLVAWRRDLRNLVRSRRAPVIELQLPELAVEQNRGFTLLAAGYQRACGCAAGRVFMTLAVAGMIGYLVTRHRIVDLELWHGAAVAAGATVAAVTGKLTGLLWARLRLLMLVTAVHRAARRSVDRRSTLPESPRDRWIPATATTVLAGRDNE